MHKRLRESLDYGASGVRAVDELVAQANERSFSHRQWFVGGVIGAIVTGVVAYGAARNVWCGVTEGSPGDVVQGAGYFAIGIFMGSATKQMIVNFLREREEILWHQLPVEESAVE